MKFNKIDSFVSFVRFHNFVKDLNNIQQTFMNSSISNLRCIVPSILQTKQWRKPITWLEQTGKAAAGEATSQTLFGIIGAN